MSSRRAVALVLAFTVLASACSPGESAEEYFVKLEAVSSALNSELDDLEGTFNAGLLEIDFSAPGAEQQLIALFQASIADTADAFAGLVAGIDALEPPSDLQTLHGEAVLAGERVLDEYAARSGELAAIASLDDIDRYAEALSASGIRQRFTESCRELQVTADQAEGIAVDLGCS